MSKPRLLLLTQYFPPETNAAAKRLLPMAYALAESFQVTVSTLKPSYPSPEHFKGTDLEDFDQRLPFEIHRLPARHPHPPSLFKRALMEIRMARQLCRSHQGSSFDIILASSPNMFLGPCASLMAHRTRAKFIWDVRDVTWHYVRQGASKGLMTRLLLPLLERAMAIPLKRADLILTPTEEAKQIMTSQGMDPGKCWLSPNGIDRRWLNRTATMAMQGPDNPGDHPIVLYAGVLGINQGLSNLIEAAEHLPGFRFVLAGDGPERPTLQAMAQAKGLTNVEFVGYLSQETLLAWYEKSHILFAQLTPGAAETAVPSKIFECLATGRPLFFVGEGPAGEMLEDNLLGWVTSTHQAEELIRVLQLIVSSYPIAKQRSLSARHWVESNFCRESIFSSLTVNLKDRFNLSF